MAKNELGEYLINGKPLSALRVVDLKEELEKRGMSKSGNKKDLTDRLKARLKLEEDGGQAATSGFAVDHSLDQATASNDFVRLYLANQQLEMQKQIDRRQIILSGELNPAIAAQAVAETAVYNQQQPAAATIMMPVVTQTQPEPKQQHLATPAPEIALEMTSQIEPPSQVVISEQQSIIQQQELSVQQPSIISSNAADLQKTETINDSVFSESEDAKMTDNSNSVTQQVLEPVDEVPAVVVANNESIEPTTKETATSPKVEISQVAGVNSGKDTNADNLLSTVSKQVPSELSNSFTSPPSVSPGSASQKSSESHTQSSYFENVEPGEIIESEPIKANGSIEKTTPQTRKLNLIRTSSSDTQRNEERKRRWGSTSSNVITATPTTTLISSDALKDLIKPKLDFDSQHSIADESVKIDEKTDNRLPAANLKATDSKVSPIADQQQLVAEAEKIPEISTVEKSPARNSPSNVVLVENLVRPINMHRLKELLCKCGKMQADKFWVDSSRFRCYAVYDNEEIAIESRNYLHGLKWPTTNPKTLSADFVPFDELQQILENEKLERDRAAAALVAPDSAKSTTSAPTKSESIDIGAQVDLAQKSQTADIEKLDGQQHSTEKEQPLPSKNPVSCVLFVRNLVRPFTNTQLEELLEKDGPMIKDKFWIDKIKSKCYAVYESEELAQKTRNRLHGLQWPSGNPKSLLVDFSTEELLARAVGRQKDEEVKRTNRAEEEESRKRKKLDDDVKPQAQGKQDRIRETDQDKGDVKSTKKSRDQSPSADCSNKGQVPDSTARLLDDLFKKTIAAPSVYWLPLTEEESQKRRELLAEKEKLRQQKISRAEAERAAREKERNSRMMNNNNNHGARNRSPLPPRRSPPPTRRSPMPRRSPPRRDRSPLGYDNRRSLPRPVGSAGFRDRERNRALDVRERSSFAGNQRRPPSPPRGGRFGYSPPEQQRRTPRPRSRSVSPKRPRGRSSSISTRSYSRSPNRTRNRSRPRNRSRSPIRTRSPVRSRSPMRARSPMRSRSPYQQKRPMGRPFVR